jgi:DUF1016 N-terminal domain
MSNMVKSQQRIEGFSDANLRNFRQFYLTYLDPEICYALCSKLTWTELERERTLILNPKND